MVYRHCFIAAFTLMTSVLAVAAPMDKARRWIDAKFLGIPDDYVAPTHLLVQLKSGVWERNGIKNRLFKIAGERFKRGIAISRGNRSSIAGGRSPLQRYCRCRQQ